MLFENGTFTAGPTKLYLIKSSTHNFTIADAITKTGLDGFLCAFASPRFTESKIFQKASVLNRKPCLRNIADQR